MTVQPPVPIPRSTTLSLTEPPALWVGRYARVAFVLVITGAFASGVVATLGAEARGLTILTFASALSVWCGLDARVHGKLFLRSFGWIMLFTWPAGLLVYLVWTRRWRGILTYLVLAFAFFLVAGAGATLANVLSRALPSIPVLE